MSNRYSYLGEYAASQSERLIPERYLFEASGKNPHDVVYVVNRSYENRPDGVRITICTLNEDFIGEFGAYGEGDGEFVWPSAIALDSDGKVYIADEWLKRISLYDKDGNFLSKWGTP